MNTIILLVILGFVGAIAVPLEEVQDAEEGEYILVPLHRVRRQSIGGNVNRGANGGISTSVHGTAPLLNTNRHRLDGTAFAQRDFHPKGPLTTGGQLDYTHKPSGSTLGVGGQNTRGFGTDVTATGRYNIYTNKNTDFYTQGQYSRHYGGPYGTGRPNYNVGLGFQHRF